MPTLIGDHQLQDFDQWFALFKENPPPAIGAWRVLRHADDPNRVYVIGEVADSEVDDVKAFFASDKMSTVLGQANDMSVRPIEFLWLHEV